MSNRLFFTGDIHLNIDIKKLSFKNWPESRNLDKTDILIICGDAGLTWDNSKETNYWCDWLEDRPYTIVSVKGNHENYTTLNELSIEEWNSGKIRKVRPHLMYLENGNIFNICDHTIFVQGGACSIDKIYRKEGISWWPQEIPSVQEFEHAVQSLERVNFNIDIIVSHTAPNSIINRIDKFYPQYDEVTNFLEKIVYSQTTYNNWLCGHFHIDRTIPDQHFHFLYNDILELLPNNELQIMR